MTPPFEAEEPVESESQPNCFRKPGLYSATDKECMICAFKKECGEGQPTKGRKSVNDIMN